MDTKVKGLVYRGFKKPFKSDKDKAKAYKNLFGTEQGGRVLQDLLAELGYFKPFIPNANLPSTDAQGNFHHGKMFACGYLINLLNVDIEEVEDIHEIEGDYIAVEPLQ